MEVGPQRRDSIQISVSLNVIEVNPFSPANYQGFFFPEALHLGKGMPEIIPVPLHQNFGIVIPSFPRSDGGHALTGYDQSNGVIIMCKKMQGRKSLQRTFF